MLDSNQVIENTAKKQSLSIYVFPSVPSPPLKPPDLQSPPPMLKKPPDTRVVTSIDQPYDYVTLQKFPPLMDWSSSTTIIVEAKMMDLESIQRATAFLQ
jgi:hypothetical protein